MKTKELEKYLGKWVMIYTYTHEVDVGKFRKRKHRYCCRRGDKKPQYWNNYEIIGIEEVKK